MRKIKAAHIAIWRRGVVMDIGDIPAMDIVVAMAIPITEGITVEDGTDDLTTGLIIEAIMAAHMAAATIAGVEGIGLASGSKGKHAYRTECEY
jgi:hypothetical protein